MTQDAARDIKKVVSEEMKEEIRNEVLQETRREIQSASAPEWTKRIRFGGDNGCATRPSTSAETTVTSPRRATPPCS
jgi:hypothetical protein